MADSIQPGDIVQVKSGGPNMTVASVGENSMTGAQMVWCEWLDRSHQPHKETFSPAVLQKV